MVATGKVSTGGAEKCRARILGTCTAATASFADLVIGHVSLTRVAVAGSTGTIGTVGDVAEVEKTRSRRRRPAGAVALKIRELHEAVERLALQERVWSITVAKLLHRSLVERRCLWRRQVAERGGAGRREQVVEARSRAATAVAEEVRGCLVVLAVRVLEGDRKSVV